MTTYYLSSVDGSDSDDGSTWALAKATLTGALAVATGNGDIIKVDSNHSGSLSADTTFTIQNNIRIICVNRSGGDALATGAVIGAQATNYNVSISCAYNLYVYGLTLSNGTNTSSTKSIVLCPDDGGDIFYENCTFDLNGSSSSGTNVSFGNLYSGRNTWLTLRNCEIQFASIAQVVLLNSGTTVFEGVTITGGSPQTYVFQVNSEQVQLFAEGCDLSVQTGTLIKDAAGTGPANFLFVNSKFGSGATILQAATTVLNKGQTHVTCRNCASGDTHYSMYHANPLGETSVSTAIYANDGATYDGTNRCSWKIVTTANCSYYTPYVSPWMDVYHDGTSAITPYLEILRDGSATAYQNDEVWVEFSYQGTSGSTQATIDNSDRMTPLGTAADQTASSLGASDWTGESGTNAYQKLAPASSITPAEIGHIRARICVGEPSITVYVDPQIRGL